MIDNKIINPNEKISYEEYKQLVIQDDIKKFTKNLKPFWWENIPLIGPIIYGVRIEIKVSGLDRGLLQKELNIVQLIFGFAFLFFIFVILLILTPWFYYWICSVALKRAKKKIEKNDI